MIVAALALCGCSDPGKSGPPAKAPKAAEPVRINLFYTTTPTVAPGEKGVLCYGVENAKAVRLSPAQQGLYPAFSRCVDVQPAGTTKYVLTAEGADGATVTREAAISVRAAAKAGAPKPTGVRIVQVGASAARVSPGQMVTICYQVEQAEGVRIDPLGYHAGPDAKGCATDQPRQTTRYTIIASGAGGEARKSVTVEVGSGR
jgi:hypothetical protein